MEPKLTIELVPGTQWGINLRSRLPKESWDFLRRKTYLKAGFRCEVCNGVGPKWPVECHEIWGYNDEENIQTLKGLIALCPLCHQVKHMGRSIHVGKAEETIQQLMDVNGWCDETAETYIINAFKVWEKRSRYNWQIDLSWLDQFVLD